MKMVFLGIPEMVGLEDTVFSYKVSAKFCLQSESVDVRFDTRVTWSPVNLEFTFLVDSL